MKSRTNLIGIVLATTMLLLAQPAEANGLVIDVAQLQTKLKQRLQQQIQTARKQNPQNFQALSDLRRELMVRDARKRGRMSGITAAIRALGTKAFLPIVERLALRAETQPTMTASAQTAWAVNLLEALGSMRKTEAEAVLAEISQKSSTMDPLILRTATAALAKIGSDSAVQRLLRLSRGHSLRSMAALSGMGFCRRLACAKELSRRLARSQTLVEQHLLTRALGDVGNNWAWQTPRLKRRGEGTQVRSTAVTALLKGFVAYDHAGLRNHLTQAILVVDHPDTLARIDALREGQSQPKTLQALDALRTRVKNSPFRRPSKTGR